MKAFSQRLKETLEMKGVNQTELAKRTGLDKSLISNYVAGKYKAKSTNLYLIARALNVSEAWLLGYDVPMERETPIVPEENERLSEFVDLFSQLTTEQQSLVISQIKGILSNQ